jgi:hypothetical protein
MVSNIFDIFFKVEKYFIAGRTKIAEENFPVFSYHIRGSRTGWEDFAAYHTYGAEAGGEDFL